MKDQRGHHVPLTVVAAKKPGHWIIRGWMPFAKPEELRTEVERIVGTLDPDIEWTTHTYDLPAYLVYGEGDLKPGWGWPMAMVKFPYTGGDPEKGWDHYRGDPEVLRQGYRKTMGEVFGQAVSR